jgi:hypothetical protein
MKLEGSCCCGKVQFELDSKTPYPYNVCYCSICRKTNGSGGTGINIMGNKRTMKIKQGKEYLKVFEKTKGSERNFCSECGSHLWNYHPRWPDFIYPYASAIDTPLPEPPFRNHIMVDSKAPWVKMDVGPKDKVFSNYPDIGIQQWHEDNNLLVE